MAIHAPITGAPLRAPIIATPAPKSRRRPGLPGGCGVGIPVPALLRGIERALIAHDMAATRFGIASANDPGLVHRLRKGACVTPAMRDRLLAFIRSLDNGEASHA